MKIEPVDSIKNFTVKQSSDIDLSLKRQAAAGTDSIAAAQNVETDWNSESIPEKVLKEAVDRANKLIFGTNRRFEYSVHEKTKDIIIKVVDTDTRETIKEIPPKKILDMVASFMEMAGIFVDEKR